MASSDKTPQVTGLLITNIDFPRPLIRDAMVGGGFSIADDEYVPRKNGSLIIWLQSKSCIGSPFLKRDLGISNGF